MSDELITVIATGAFTFAGLVVNAWFTYKTAALARETRDTLRAASMEAPTSIMGERRVMLRTTRDGATGP